MDLCLRATLRKSGLEIAVATTTQVVRDAQTAHQLEATSLVALGRLLTGVGLMTLTSKREGTFSGQILSKGRIGQLYADCTDRGHLRGRVKVPSLGFPISPEEDPRGRRSVAAAVFPGDLSVIRSLGKGGYNQSAVPLVSGEIDEDLRQFLETSDQIPTALAAEVLLGPNHRVERAGGVLIQALPDGDPARLAELRGRLEKGGLAKIMEAEPVATLAALAPDAVVIDQLSLVWKCRCSEERVLASLRMLEATDLAEMIAAEVPVVVDCDLCAKKYEIQVDQIRQLFAQMIKAEG